MNTHVQLFCRAGVFLVALMATMISCSKDKDSPEPEYKARMAPGVTALQWENGVARVHVSQGDIVAVFSTTSDTVQIFPFTIQYNVAKTVPDITCPESASFRLPYELSARRYRPTNMQADVTFGHKHKLAVKAGNTETFWTWDLGEIENYPDIPSVQFTAVLKAAGNYCDVYVDENSSLITAEDAIEIARHFDEVAFPVVTTHFGDPPVVGGSSRVAILLPLAFNGGMEDEVNPNGWAAGAFNDKDQFPPSDNNPYSNYRNALYLNPGLYNSSIPVFVEKWRSILSHEFLHLVNYRYHGINEAVPIDEGKALLAEILSGYGLPNGDFLMWANVVAYQDDPSGISLLQMEMAPENPWGSYGMGLLWVCYLYDRFGSQVIYNMATHPLPGLGGAETVTGIPKQHLFAEWLQANILSGTVNDKIFDYQTIDVVGDGGGRFYGKLNGFAALPEHAIPAAETLRHIHSYGLDYFRADTSGELIIKGNNIRVFVISKTD